MTDQEKAKIAIEGDDHSYVVDLLAPVAAGTHVIAPANFLDYCKHESYCVLACLTAGEPTEDGGYRQKFRGQWYQYRPVDETPACECGLDAMIKAAGIGND